MGVADEKQCGHQDGKVTVPHADFHSKIRALRYAFLELGIDNGIIVARTDSEGAGLTKEIAVVKEPGDAGDIYNSFLDVEEVTPEETAPGDVLISRDGKLVRPKRLPSGLYQFRQGTGHERCVFDCIGAIKDHASIQINLAEVDESTGRMTGAFKTYAICGAIRRMGESDDCINRLAKKDGILDKKF